MSICKIKNADDITAIVKEQGGKAYHGLKMLLYQGIEAFELWNQVRVSEELSNKVYEIMKGEMNIEE